MLLIAGGSGIGPIRALAEDLAGHGADVVLLFRASSWDDVVLYAELEQLVAGGTLAVCYLVGRRLELGRDPLAPAALRALLPDVADREVYVCGPDGMTRTVLRSLRILGVRARQLHTEQFSLR